MACVIYTPPPSKISRFASGLLPRSICGLYQYYGVERLCYCYAVKKYVVRNLIDKRNRGKEITRRLI